MIRKLLCLSLLLISILSWSADVKLTLNKLEYTLDAKGNRILDYSFCGYKKSDTPIPELKFVSLGTKASNSLQAVKIVYNPEIKDYTSILQSAIKTIEKLPLNAAGFRGAVLLTPGVYTLSSTLYVQSSGVILRGQDKNTTILKKVGPDRFPFISIEGKMDRKILKSTQIEDTYLPSGSLKFQVSQSDFRISDELLIHRPSTKEWISRLKCNDFGGDLGYWGWKPGDADMNWIRTVADVEGENIVLDAPLAMSVDQSEGRLQISSFEWKGRIENCAVENLSMESDYDRTNKLDEDHAWTGISIDNARDCWVRNLNFKYLAGSAVVLQPNSSRITVQDCISESPVSEIAGMRRTTFLTLGQLNLFQRCFSEKGIHEFSAGYGAPGPNAFVQCESSHSLGFSGAIDLWAPGLLFDVIRMDGDGLSFKNMGIKRQGAGWNTGNSMFWQCAASDIECFSPDSDNKNRAYGCWAILSGDGDWSDANNHIYPRSFFYKQLEDRLGKLDLSQSRILNINTDATSSPTEAQARELTDSAALPLITMRKWIEYAPSLKVHNIEDIQAYVNKNASPDLQKAAPVQLEEGRLVQYKGLLAGSKMETAWWHGKVRPKQIEESKPHITRFVPDRFGFGLTDNIDSVVRQLKSKDILMMDHHYSLWYDRRRDDHERVRRRDGDVWAPFYEQAFARSGSEEKAWDGLSLYDLNKPNKWYWSRLREFASKAEKEGILLNEQHFFQHNIIEAGAHYVDSPWRTANNVNDMGLPEPVNFAGDKRIFYSEMFYDLNYPGRKAAFRNYIRTCLDSLSDYSNVIHSISDEYTGPQHFAEFWIDVIDEWQKESGKDVKVALSVTKDVQDAILKDSRRAAVVDIIDIRYWHPRNDGTDYAPEGGKNLAPRQFARKMKVGKTEYYDVYNTVLNYRTQYPEKAVSYFAQFYPENAWAVAMAGGSCPDIRVNDKTFQTALSSMRPEIGKTGYFDKLVKNGTEIIIYSHQSQELPLGLMKGKYVVRYVNPQNGDIKTIFASLKVGEKTTLNIEKGVYWVRKL